MIKENRHEQKTNYERGKVIQTWLTTGISGPEEDGATSFRIFLTKISRFGTSSGGNSLRRLLPLGGQLCGTGLDLHDALRRRRRVFAEKNHRGNWQETEG
jgi:hypothetical protein